MPARFASAWLAVIIRVVGTRRTRIVTMALRLASLAAAAALTLLADIVVVENTAGAISVRVANRDDVDVRGRCDTRTIQPSDIEIERTPGAGMRIEANPADGAKIDLEIEVPYQTSLGITTLSGKIAVEGMPAALDVETESGDLELALPWYSSYLDFQAEQAPDQLKVPDHLERKDKKGRLQLAQHRRVGRDFRGYTEVRVRTETSRDVELREIPIPEDSPIKMHWQGPAALDALFRHKGPVRLQERSGPATDSEPAAKADFRTEVDWVDLLVHVTDKQGRILTDLKPEDFQVTENGVQQTLHSAARVDIPVNIVVFLDWNNSMRGKIPLTLHAVNGFIDSLRPGDKLAIHAAVRNIVHFFPRLTDDRTKLRQSMTALNRLNVSYRKLNPTHLGGTSTLWDPMLVSMTDELPEHDSELNIFIPVTMGVDVFSKIPFPKLRRGVEQMASDFNIRCYPIAVTNFLLWGPSPSPDRHPVIARMEQGRRKLGVLAKAGQGWVFEAEAPRQIGATLKKILAEVGSVYSLSYAPAQTDDDAAWKRVEVEIDRPDAVVRHRPGYFAHP